MSKYAHSIQGVLVSGCCIGVPLYTEVSSFQGVLKEFHYTEVCSFQRVVEEFHCIQGVLISGHFRGVPLYTRCPHFRMF